MTHYAPYWWQEAPIEAAQPAPHALPSSVDYLIVGGGYAGLSAALYLAENNQQVLVCEGDRLGAAAATRNGGICSGNLYVSHASLSRKYGREYADQLYLEGAAARQDLRDFMAHHAIDGDFQPSGRLTCAVTRRDYEAQCADAEQLSKIAGYEVSMVSQQDIAQEIQSPAYVGGMLREDIGGFHPAKFYHALLRLCRQAGVLFAEQAWVKSIDKMQKIHYVNLNKGVVKAGKVLITSNAYTQRQFAIASFLKRRLVPVTSGIIVTEQLGKSCVQELMPRLRMYGDTSKLFNYFRPTPDHTRILLGSRSDEYHQASAVTRDHLHQRLVTIFPELKQVGIDYCWSGQVGFFVDNKPRIFVHDDIFYSAGYAGSGTVWARWLGLRAAELMLHGETSSHFFTKPPKAIPFYYGRPWFVPFVLRYYQLQDSLKNWRTKR